MNTLGDDPKKLAEKAKWCDNCLCWLNYCEAECCRQFHFPLGPMSDVSVYGTDVRVRIPMSPDRKWYFELHRIEVLDDVLIIPEVDCRFTESLLSVYRSCRLLTQDRLCSGHPDDKPDICKNVTLDNARKGRCDLTPNCLFIYKQ